MNRGHALRYLLLKHLWKHREAIQPQRRKAIARSLIVGEASPEAWSVEWNDGIAPGRVEIPINSVHFYKRGDTPTSAPADGELDRKTEEAGRRFVEALLNGGVRGAPNDDAAVMIAMLSLAGTMAVVSTTIATDGPRLAVAGAFVATAMILEFIPRYGRIGGALLMALLVVSGLPLVALVANAAGALLQWLDPDPRWRTGRVAIHLAALVALPWWWAAVTYPEFFGGWAIFALIASWALAVAIVRWVNGSHKRVFPLVFPLICLAFALTGLTTAAVVGLIGASIGLAVITFRRGTIPV
jgi:hypothetical protein